MSRKPGMARVALSLALVLGLGVAPVWADFAAQGGEIGSDSTPMKTVVVTVSGATQSTHSNSVGNFGANMLIYGFKLLASGTNATCQLWDAATVPNSGTTGFIDEQAEATAGETDLQIWPSPFKLTTDLSVLAENGTCIIYYR